MTSLLWTTCFAILLLVAVADLVLLLRAGGGPAPRGAITPFTLACQAGFAVFGALHIGPLAFEGFDLARAVMLAELVFLVLMLVGAVRGLRAARG